MPIRRTSNKSSYDSGFYNPEVYSDVGSRLIFQFDSNALTYINAVEAADGQALEFNVKTAYNAFVVGCKSDGIWNAIKASCIMAGARTLSGALVSLVGVAPSGFNLASGEYSRASGLKGDGVSMYLNTNRAHNADLQDNHHLSVFATLAASGTMSYIGADTYFGDGRSTSIYRNNNVPARLDTRSRAASQNSGPNTASSFLGFTRSASGSYTARVSGINTSHLVSSLAGAGSESFLVFARNTSPVSLYADARLSFYSIGESLDPALLDNRITVLMSGIQNGIS